MLRIFAKDNEATLVPATASGFCQIHCMSYNHNNQTDFMIKNAREYFFHFLRIFSKVRNLNYELLEKY